MRRYLETTSPRKDRAGGCEVRREPRPLKEERKCFGVAEPEKRGKREQYVRGSPRGSLSGGTEALQIPWGHSRCLSEDEPPRRNCSDPAHLLHETTRSSVLSYSGKMCW
ncbi:cAMP-regulated phosphoprotein 19 isoform 3-T5 [Hipposideros larvatus]